MNIFRKLLLAVLAAAVCLLAAGCGSEEPVPSAHYESVLDTLTAAVKMKDTHGYLLCFTEAARLTYEASERYDRDLTSKLVPQQEGETPSLLYTVTEHRELTAGEVSALEEAYKNKYSLRLDITKAYELKVVFTAGSRHTERTVNAVNNGSGWLVLGPVIEKLFEGSADSSSAAA
ncbi:MAG: hypothetical protein IKN17_04060 [Ruminococcus sp.]|nr:hypothetical protein [Ruminococcus sp.]